MSSSGRPPQRHVDADGVRVTQTGGVRRGVWILVIVMAFLAVAFVFGVRTGVDRHTDEIRQSSSAPAPPIPGSQRQKTTDAYEAVPIVRARPLGGDPAGAATPPAPEPDAEAATDAADGEASGVALFPPMGTKPIKRGILVPEDFELPPGYVRHYQATDDGERVPAILMFHPDYEFVDEQGKRIEIPEDRVVPPELVPPGMPIQMLELPESEGGEEK